MSTHPEIDIKVSDDIDKFLTLDKQFIFGITVALTKTAQEAQKTYVPEELKKHFKLRTEWYKPERKYGIKITPANKTNLTAQVRTAADWLEDHETTGGATRKPHSKSRLAIPEGEKINPVRIATTDEPKRLPSGIIAKAQRPSRLLGTGKGKRKYKGRPFTIKLKKAVWLARRIKGELFVKYFMLKEVRIKEDKTVEPGTFRAVEEKFADLFQKAFEKAIETAKKPPKTP
jgi:hypothetical protein